MAEPAGEAPTSPNSGPPRMGEDIAEIMERLRRRPSLIRILATLDESGGSLWTRELIRRIGSWTHTHRRLLELAALGLIRRFPGEANGRHAVWNELTPLGRGALSRLRAEGHPSAWVRYHSRPVRGLGSWEPEQADGSDCWG